MPGTPQENRDSQNLDRNSEPVSYRFGPFKVLVESGVLLRRGERIRVEDLPLRMLLVLLQQPSQLVSREELRSKLWGENTFGASDNRLNVAAAKLREALQDPLSEIVYLETVRGKGYVLTSEVVEERLPTPARPIALKAPTPIFEEISAPPETSESLSPKRRFSLRGTAVLAAAVLLTVAGLGLYRWQTRPLITPHAKIVIGGFRNSTGDDSMNGILLPALRFKLEESPYLAFVSYRDLRGRLKDPALASLTDELKACDALGAKLLIEGEIALQTPGYELRLTARRCADGSLLATERSPATSQEQTLGALGAATLQLRRRLGEPANSLERFNVPVYQATTASLAALKAFSNGEQKRLEGQETEAVSDYKLSADLDPQFALAYARLGTIYDNLGEHLLSRQYYQKAFDLRERATDRERLYITSHYYSSATGEIERAIQAQELWRTLYPRDHAPANNLAIEYLALGQLDKAMEVAKIAQGLDSSSDLGNATLAAAYLRRGDYAALTPFCSHPMPARSDSSPIHSTCFLLGFVRGDRAAMKSQLEWARGNPAGSELLEEAAWTATYGGQVEKAEALFSEAHENAMTNGLPEFAAQIDADRADLMADLGEQAQARQYANNALALAPNSVQVQAYAALALARTGDVARAEVEAAKAAAQSPKDTILQSSQLAAVKASVALAQHNPEEAIRALEPSIPFDLCGAMSLSPAYYRGLAYLAMKRPVEASREFQKVIDHRTLAPDSPYIPLSYLYLSRALQLTGDSKRSLAMLDQLRVIWKDADRDFPLARDISSSK
jgi:DNA-binding winged helix-turn-helix (wHTH) protein/tetratricopeptide (TPR) repeat protein